MMVMAQQNYRQYIYQYSKKEPRLDATDTETSVQLLAWNVM